MFVVDTYDVIVIGAGHAGCEAALASARLGAKTLMATLNLDNIALMPCNPAVGGPGKSHLVREIDALGGEMGINTDKTCLQMRMLNTGKGPAVYSLRAQSDKKMYQMAMTKTLENQDHLDVKRLMITDLLVEDAPSPVSGRNWMKFIKPSASSWRRGPTSKGRSSSAPVPIPAALSASARLKICRGPWSRPASSLCASRPVRRPASTAVPCGPMKWPSRKATKTVMPFPSCRNGKTATKNVAG